MPTYPSNRGVGASLEFCGLKGQYIYLAIGAFLILFVLAVVLSNTSIPVLLVIMLVIGTGTLLFGGLIKLSQRFGRHGLMKLLAMKRLPVYVRNICSVKKILNIK